MRRRIAVARILTCCSRDAAHSRRRCRPRATRGSRGLPSRHLAVLGSFDHPYQRFQVSAEPGAPNLTNRGTRARESHLAPPKVNRVAPVLKCATSKAITFVGRARKT